MYVLKSLYNFIDSWSQPLISNQNKLQVVFDVLVVLNLGHLLFLE